MTSRIVLGLVLIAGVAGAAIINPAGLGEGRYARMSMKLEKTWFGVDVVRVELWFDAETRDRLRSLAQGRRYSGELADQIARTALDAQHVFARISFLRDVSLGQFLDALRDSLGHARAAGLISPASYDESMRRVRQAFAPLARRGFEDGDQILYLARAGSLRSMVVADDGGVLVDVTVRDPRARLALLAGYLAPGGDFREGLIASLFR